MDASRLKQSLDAATPPATLSGPLRALWHAGKGEWEAAHGIVQAQEGDPDHDWVHAHLHRIEGDLSNARYWYRRAGRAVPDEGLDAEWCHIVDVLSGSAPAMRT
jgi:hypothetical protein